MGKLLRVVWNLTNRCYYNCGICAASANKRRELTLEQKQHILKNIVAYGKVNIDFSGGDPLFHPDDRTVIQSASEMLGKDNISISTTGHSLQGLADSEILSMSTNYELTYDYPVRYNNTDPRHHTYNPLNIEQSRRVKGLGADVGIFSPVQNIGDKQIEAWAEDLAELSPDSVNLIRLMPVGNLKEKPQFNEVEVYNHMV